VVISEPNTAGGSILAVQPDAAQAAILERALADYTRAELTVVSSANAALARVDRTIPDVILLDAFMRPPDEDYLLAYVRALPGTGHVQVISLPHLQSTPPPDSSPPRRGLFGRLSRSHNTAFTVPAYDARMFASDAADYLHRACDIRSHADYRITAPDPSNRRGNRRWAAPDVPWVSSVQLMSGERADLINLSSRGALVRTEIRPPLLARTHHDLDHAPQPGLTLQLSSGMQVRAQGRVIRCQMKAESLNVAYDVAFQFDTSLGLTLPLPDHAGQLVEQI
jgi:CheY-like chemotaxis protein